jgi:hypothetical protein
MSRHGRLFALALLIAALAGLLSPAEAAVSVTVTPSSTTFSEDVTTPGTGWTFDSAASWFPAGWNSAYTYHTSGCVAVAVSGVSKGWSLNAYYTTSPSTPVNAAVAQAGTGSTCSTPGSAGTPLSASSSSATALLSNVQNSGQTTNYYVTVQPTVAVTTSVTVTITFTASGVSKTLGITMSPGNAFAVTVTPSATSFSEDVTAPGAGWTFNTSALWFPAGWSSGYTYQTSGCLAVKVTTSVQGWKLTAYYTTSPSTSINVALAHAGTGSTCSAPGSAGTSISASSGSPTTLVSGQNGTQTINYYIVVQPAIAITSNVAITTTLASQ